MINKLKFFFNGEFSNWFPAKFTVDGITYNCGEQYMMHQKALFFNDTFTAKKIMESPSPRMQKAFGRKVNNFVNASWDAVKYNLVKRGLREKFTQNPELKELLLQFKGHTFVEASPYDKVWGIGFEQRYAMKNYDHWGQNLLGKILTELSQEL